MRARARVRVRVCVLCVWVIKRWALNWTELLQRSNHGRTQIEDNHPTASDQSTFASSFPVKYEKGVQVIHPGRIREREREREGNIKREGVSQQRVEDRNIVPAHSTCWLWPRFLFRRFINKRMVGSQRLSLYQL